MEPCAKNCTPSKIGKWYQIVRDHLDTRSFTVKDSSFNTVSGNQNISVLDIRLNPSSSHLTPLDTQSAIKYRLSAERILHQLYLMAVNKRNSASQVGPSINSVYMSLKYTYPNWRVFCDKEEQALGLCKQDIQASLVSQLRQAINLSKTLHQGSCCLPIHLSLTLFSERGILNHANSLLINTKCKRIGLFEPLGRISKFRLSQSQLLEYELHRCLSQLGKQLGYKFIGNITPQCNFQDDNSELCYLWTTWIEWLSVVNPWLTPAQIGYYLNHRYQKLRQRPSRRYLALMFANYLKEIALH